MKHLSSPEPLETRIALNGSAIGKALGVPAGSSVFDYSQASAIAVGSNFGANGLIGFPTGADDQFVILSTGDATRFNLAGYSHHGTDWTSKGPDGDAVSVDITLPVPSGASRLKLDFMFLTQEEPDSPTHVNEYEDFFKITANAGAGRETLVDYNVDNVFYMPGAEAGPNFKHRTLLLTMNYQVPLGATSISLHMELGDDLDGTGDTAVIMDNLRFEKAANLVYLNFEGGSSPLFGAGSQLAQTAFQVADLNSAQNRAALISSIVSTVEQNFTDWDVSFVTTLPAEDHATVLIGGDNTSVVTLNTNPFNGPVANPLLVTQLGGTSGTYLKAGGYASSKIIFGQAPSVDIGNATEIETVVIFSQEYGQFYTAETDTQLVARIASTISHELGHSLGLRHVTNASPSNIMSQNSPRNLDASFEDLSRPLAETWPDRATTQNDADYLDIELGPAVGSSIGLGISPRELLKYVLATIPFTGGIYNAYLGVLPGQPLESDTELDAAPQILALGNLHGTELLKIPNWGDGTKFFLYGQSTPGGAIDIFSGVPDGAGDLSLADSALPLFDGAGGELTLNIPLALGIPGSLVAAPIGIGMEESAFTIKLLPFGTYEDAPPSGATAGDLYTIKLTTKTGIGGFTMIDPDGDGKGPIDQIVLQDTSIKDKLAITVKKPTKDQLTAGLDGRVDIGSIRGSTLASIEAKSSDLVGAGIDFGNLLGKLTIRDVRNGADISIGGGEFVKTTITARDIGDGTDIVSRASIAKLTAARIGDGTIDAPTLGTLSVKGDKLASIAGDFRSDLKLAHSSPFLTLALFKKAILGSATITGTTEGVTIDIDGSAGSFKTGRFVDSTLDVQSFFPAAKLGSFAATGIKNNVAAAFDNSRVIANIIGGAKLASIDTSNSGVPFGITATDSIGSVSGVLLPSGDSFKYDKNNPLAQGSGNFVVQVV